MGAMFPVTLFVLVTLFALAAFVLLRRKATRAPGLREAMLIIGTGIVLFVIWITLMKG